LYAWEPCLRPTAISRDMTPRRDGTSTKLAPAPSSILYGHQTAPSNASAHHPSFDGQSRRSCLRTMARLRHDPIGRM
jgi:hypothetical protein